MLKEKLSVAEPSSQLMEEPSSYQGADPPNIEPEEAPMGLLIVVESSRPDKGKSLQVVEPTGDMSLSKIADECADDIVCSIEDLFTYWGQVKTSRSTSTGRLSASSEEDMKFLKQSIFEYVSFMDMDIGQASATKHKDKLELLSAKLVQTLTLSLLNISADFKATLKVVHFDILSLLAKNNELNARSIQYLRAASERDSLLLEINKAEDELKEISSEVMIKDSLMTSLAVEMKELQAKMDDCRTRMAAKKRNASQGIERTKSLVEQYKKLEVDDDFVAELNVASSQQSEDWGRLREMIRSAWGEL
ncbi:Hypothetical predicted protein [Olea europaea subsp. europaea]|uniref:Uncharacterized protein n=1 Tax=Olea europaea subsp. europaea TaxID=158383 RepID=A0A8S0SZ78_OLEEU|nr:Hypothetical predicted protein [Olea europaea subsp. europaea]